VAQRAGLALPGKTFVQRTLPIAFEIQRNVGKARSLQSGCDGGSHFRGHRARHLFRGDLNPRELFVQANAKLPEAQFAQGGLSALYESQLLGGYFGSVGEARGKACRGGTVPGGQAGAVRKRSNLGFTKTRVEQRSENLMIGCRAMTGAATAGIAVETGVEIAAAIGANVRRAGARPRRSRRPASRLADTLTGIFPWPVSTR